MITDYTTLKVGDQVAVAQHGSWITHNQGIYTVVKVNKVKVVVQRSSDSYEREFSVKKRSEFGAITAYRAAYLETVEDQQRRVEQYARERNIADCWKAVESAAAKRNYAELATAVEQLTQLVNPTAELAE